jgi:hypothetical protein
MKMTRERERWARLIKAIHDYADLKVKQGQPAFSEQFVERHGEQMRELTVEVAQAAADGDAEMVAEFISCLMLIVSMLVEKKLDELERKEVKS